MLNLTYKALNNDCLPFFQKCLLDQEVIRYSRSIFQKFTSEQDIVLWVENLLIEDLPFQQGIYLDNQLIGYAGFCNQNEACTSAEFFLFIGDKKQWGKGIGTQVTQDFIQIGFEYFDWISIFLTVLEPNQAAVKLYNKVGFRLENTFQDSCLREGKYHNKLLMRIFKSNEKIIE